MESLGNKRSREPLNIGIFGISGQSGKAYLADLLGMPVRTYGYARPSDAGRATVDAIQAQGGIELQRPANTIEATSTFVPLGRNAVGHDLERLAETSDLIIFAHPSVYHEATARQMADVLARRRVPLILSPSRTLATPYLWNLLGDRYPVFSFATCPYSCKTYSPGSTFIKRRKKNWIASVEGDVPVQARVALKRLFPQIIYSHVPATTSLGNIGAVFHPTAYMLNLDTIQERARVGQTFSFYVEGIARNPEVGRVVGQVDQIRLQIAQALGCSVFGLESNPREEEFAAVMQRLADLEKPNSANARQMRYLRAANLQPIHDSVVSAQHWLDYTYGVKRIPGESLASAIGRTPHFQEKSYPQQRYADEDIPTGLVPLESLAERLGIPHAPLTRVIDLYERVTGNEPRRTGRNLEIFDTEYLRSYLLGQLESEQSAALNVAG
jgi:hypothetical protein